ncbi:hypothetical protein AX777_04725 [Sphingobium yanoikuyae]|jgi:hypothetical protein|uniref:HNH endonuclease 5 domain-containing protein n=1 Tax=Sphingobium yanoikuyae TaxID=13690 RepID=A0A177JQB4_SPHYA|nr:HNH endonuclease [Sphingobium yanoikuyae]MAM40394.1 HNH endonuclease [Erythrobacter sp.]OAH42561.1 hypothetical protein AX777_04725 [Sphingobium yanoikuyae]|tara:strand:- start:262 stop:1146 length:885 start_codon:yes stop_codon:yes gene_type:complete
MKLKEFDLEKFEQRVVASPGICIYCGITLPPEELTDEHVIPYALGHNTLIFEKSSCKQCAEIIQPYEQAVLRQQLGDFRLKVDAPSRTKKRNRPTTVTLPFVEIDGEGRLIRDLGTRTFPLAEAPLVLNLWTLPEAGIMRGDLDGSDLRGRPWSFADHTRADEINRQIAAETGAIHVAMKVGEVNRDYFLRFLAKTAHAYATADLGLDGFTPFLNDLILNQAHDLTKFVGGTLPLQRSATNADTVLMSIGTARDLVAVLFQFYPSLKSPAYAIIVGAMNEHTEARLVALAEQYS